MPELMPHLMSISCMSFWPLFCQDPATMDVKPSCVSGSHVVRVSLGVSHLFFYPSETFSGGPHKSITWLIFPGLTKSWGVCPTRNVSPFACLLLLYACCGIVLCCAVPQCAHFWLGSRRLRLRPCRQPLFTSVCCYLDIFWISLLFLFCWFAGVWM